MTSRLGLRAGILAPVVWVVVIAWGDVARADLAAVTDFISELGERGSATERLVRIGGFIGTGALLAVFGGTLSVAARPAWKALIVGALVALDGIGRAGAGVYPCDPGCDGVSRSQELHRLFATIGFCSGILAALAAGLLYRRRIDLVLGLATTAFLLLMTWEENPLHAEGLWERLATGALSLWLFLFAATVLRGSRGLSVGPDSAERNQQAG